MRYNGTYRVVDNQPFFGCDVDGQQMEVGLFPGVGFQLGCFVNGEWISIKQVYSKNAHTDANGRMQMEWSDHPCDHLLAFRMSSEYITSLKRAFRVCL